MTIIDLHAESEQIKPDLPEREIRPVASGDEMTQPS